MNTNNVAGETAPVETTDVEAGSREPVCSALEPGKDCWIVWADGVGWGIFRRWDTLESPEMVWEHGIVSTRYNGEIYNRRIEKRDLFADFKAAKVEHASRLKKLRDALNALEL
jgi:hypothetical protein